MRIPLKQGAYTARSIIANCQRCVNLYAERNDDTAEVPFTFYNAPGLAPLGTSPGAPGRCLYWANNGQLYYLAGNTLYSVSPFWQLVALGTIGTTNGIASMGDNGTTLVLVDGSPNGYQVTLSNNFFEPISAANNSPPSTAVYGFYGANKVDILDGFLVLNQPGTRNFYCTYDNEVVFDSTYFAAKNGYSDPLMTLIVTRREIWLIGQRTTEIWYNVGGANFPFAIIPGPFLQHGTSATYSPAQVDGAVFWLSQDQAGPNILLRGEGYLVRRISTHALEQEWEGYSTVSDAIGFCFEFGGHSFYQINFPTANKSWRWDETTQTWHEPVYTDANGNENMHRASCVAYAYGINVAADWQTGQLYQLDPGTYTDNGMPMQFRRGFPHMMQDGRRVIYPGFTLDVQAATSSAYTVSQPGPFALLNSGNVSPYGPGPYPLFGPGGQEFLSGPTPIDNAPRVLLRYSDDRGQTWSNPVPQTLGATGKYLAQPKWSRLGMARDRVFEVFGIVPGQLAINGAFLDPEPIVLVS